MNLDVLIDKLNSAGIAANDRGEFEFRNLIREARDALEAARRVRGHIEEIQGVELLEYHNKNWLKIDQASRNESVRELIGQCLRELGTTAVNAWG